MLCFWEAPGRFDFCEIYHMDCGSRAHCASENIGFPDGGNFAWNVISYVFQKFLSDGISGSCNVFPASFE